MSEIANTPAESTAKLSKNALLILCSIDTFYPVAFNWTSPSDCLTITDVILALAELVEAQMIAPATVEYSGKEDWVRSFAATPLGEAVAIRYKEGDIDALLAGGAK